MSLVVKELDKSGMAAWDDYVFGNPLATFFHRAAWMNVLERAFGHRTYFLYAERDGEIVGILPIAEVRSIVFGHSLASLPFCVYGGIVANTEEIAGALRERACALADKLKVEALEFRNIRPCAEQDWPIKELYFTFRKTIVEDEETNLMAIPNRQRAMIRKGVKEGLNSDWDDGTERLYKVYAESVKNLGTPVFSQKYFRVLREEFGDACSVLMITHGGSDVAGVMSFYFKEEVLPYYGGSTAEARNVKGVNHFMYWELMRRASKLGFSLFDFGRSKKGTGPYSFKKNFGFDPQPLPYAYYLVKSAEMPDLNPLNPKYQLLVNTWKKLPLPVANLIGPFLARSLG
jgi:FemAB-related protein (PEP-CTERM system-associated)